MGLYCVVTLLVMAVLLEEHARVSASGEGVEDASIPVLASGKRQHNIMRFGKRPAGGHSLIHFGKRDEPSPPKHSFLYFGKRAPVPDILDYLQRGRDSYKRGHTIMRFGKRDNPQNHHFIRFGRDNNYPELEDEELEKREGHSMLYFGKRGNSGHSMMYFGKRDYDEDLEEDKRAHAMIHFGKREDLDEDDQQKRAAHSMIHFGKRDEDMDEQKRGGGTHSMIHFGKREEDIEDEKRGEKNAHSMIHFGKREEDDDTEEMNPETKRQMQHNLLRFGKKLDRKGSHAMIHFGKREVGDDKRAHAMIHFGKKSEDMGNQSLNRMKREVDQVEPLVALVRYEDETRPSEELWSPLFHQDQDWEPEYMEYSQQPEKKDGSKGSKNVFLRFG